MGERPVERTIRKAAVRAALRALEAMRRKHLQRYMPELGELEAAQAYYDQAIDAYLAITKDATKDVQMVASSCA